MEATGQVQERSDGPARDARLTERLGCRSVSELVHRVTLASRATVLGYERAARGVAERIAPSSGERCPRDPAIRAALADGAVGVDGVTAVLGPLSQIAGRAGRSAHLAADQELAACARGEGVDAAPRRARMTSAPSPRSGRCTWIRTVRNLARPSRCANAGSASGWVGTG